MVRIHTFFYSCDIDGHLTLLHNYRLVVAEDAADFLESFFHDQHTGTFGLFSTLNFKENKIMTIGDAAILTTTAKQPHRWGYAHDEIEYNFPIRNINAALGYLVRVIARFCCFQVRRFFIYYQKPSSDIIDFRLMEETSSYVSSYWLHPLIFGESITDKHDESQQDTNDAGLITRPVWRLIHQLEPYEVFPRAPLPLEELLAQRIINIPSSTGLA